LEKLMRFTLAIGLVLVFGFVSVSMGQTSQYRQISSYGMISYTAMEKTVTWADGTSETITVDDKGRIFLNGSQKIAFGFHIVARSMKGEPYDSEMVNGILDRLQGWGVRFMSMDCMSWYTDELMRTLLDFWLPKLYEHKMFVTLGIEGKPAYSIDVDSQYSRISGIIDMIIDQRYADIIFSVACGWELDDAGYTDEQVETYLSHMHPLVKSKLQASIIGDVPIVAAHSATISETGTIPSVKWSDVPSWDLFSDDDWRAYIEPRLAVYHDSTLPQAGKEGYRIWFWSNGHASGVEYYTPEMFQYLLDGGGYKDVSMIFLWCLEWDYADYPNAWFDMEGNPKPQLLDLVPYIP
jgi:hypothetical protein